MTTDPKALPQRQASVNSANEEAIPHDTNDTVGLLYDRLQAYKHACGYLEDYVEATEKFHKAAAKEYGSILKTIADPLREGYHFDQSLGGVAGMFENLRTNTQAIAQSHVDTEKNIKSHVLTTLSKLHAEIKSKAKELHSGAGKSSKAVEKAREATQKHIELLGQHSAALESAGHKINPTDDPYVIQRGTYHRLGKQIQEENAHMQELIHVQNNFVTFETHVIQTFQNAMESFHSIVTTACDRQKALYGDILGTTQRVPRDFEWKAFTTRYASVLQDPNAAPRSMKTVTFPNQDHKATQPLIEGTLDRKGKILKSYDTGYYVVTPAMYLHEFKDTDNEKKDPLPENSLYLPDCTVGSLNSAEHKFNVKGRDSNKGKIGLNLSQNREYQFRAHSAADAEKWYAIISSCAGTVGGSQSSVGSPTSPTAAAAAGAGAGAGAAALAHHEHHPPAYAERPHVETGTTGGPVAAEGITHSPATAAAATSAHPAHTSPTAATTASPTAVKTAAAPEGGVVETTGTQYAHNTAAAAPAAAPSTAAAAPATTTAAPVTHVAPAATDFAAPSTAAVPAAAPATTTQQVHNGALPAEKQQMHPA